MLNVFCRVRLIARFSLCIDDINREAQQFRALVFLRLDVIKITYAIKLPHVPRERDNKANQTSPGVDQDMKAVECKHQEACSAQSQQIKHFVIK